MKPLITSFFAFVQPPYFYTPWPFPASLLQSS